MRNSPHEIKQIAGREGIRSNPAAYTGHKGGRDPIHQHRRRLGEPVGTPLGFFRKICATYWKQEAGFAATFHRGGCPTQPVMRISFVRSLVAEERREPSRSPATHCIASVPGTEIGFVLHFHLNLPPAGSSAERTESRGAGLQTEGAKPSSDRPTVPATTRRPARLALLVTKTIVRSAPGLFIAGGVQRVRSCGFRLCKSL
jgi:hypothetical protein